MDPNDLRDCVEQAIVELIEPVAWERCEVINRAEQESLRTILEKWGSSSTARPEQQIQRAVLLYFRARSAPGVFAFHPANGGYRCPVEAEISARIRRHRRRVPDVIAIHQGRC